MTNNRDIFKVEKSIDLLKFKYKVLEKFIHSVFNAYIMRQVAIIGLFVGVLQIDFGSKNFLFYVNIILITLILLLLSHINYQNSMRKISYDAIRFEHMINENYKKLDELSK